MTDKAGVARAAPRAKKRTALVLLIIIAALVVGFFLWNFLDKPAPLSWLPARVEAYACLGSVSATLDSLTGLKAMDEILAAPGMAQLRATLLTLRANDFLNSRAFRFFGDVPAHIALSDGTVLVASDLRLLGLAARLLPIAGPILPKSLAYARKDGISYLSLGQGQGALRMVLRGRLLLASPSEAALGQALARGLAPALAQGAGAAFADAKTMQARARASGLKLDPPKAPAIRFLVDGGLIQRRFAEAGGLAANIAQSLEFPQECLFDLSLDNARISLDASLPIKSKDEKLGAMLRRRSAVPSVLPLLPAGTEYLSLLAGGGAAEMADAILPFLGNKAAVYGKVDQTCKALFGKGLDELLWSWIGGELGAFGLASSKEPVFFARIVDEQKRRQSFELLLSSSVLGSDESTVVGGLRIPKLALPWFVRELLSLFEVQLPEPYWLVSRGFLFISSSAENLSEIAAASASGNTLPGTETSKSILSGTRADASAALYYSLDRSLPFFMRASAAGPIERALRLYGRGILLLRTGPEGVSLSLRAVAVPGSRGIIELPGFPFQAQGRLAASPVVSGYGPDARLLLNYDSGTIVSKPIASGEETRIDLGAPAWLLLDGSGKKTKAIWALTKEGVLYRFDAQLRQDGPFPLITGYKPSSAPALVPDSAGGGIAFGLKEGGLLFVDELGTTRRVELGYSPPLLAPPVFSDKLSAAYAKGFEGTLHLLDARGQALPGWPLTAPGLGYGSPAFLGAKNQRALGFLTQSGKLDLYSIEGASMPGFPLELGGNFFRGLAASPDGGFFCALSSEGRLIRISREGIVEAEYSDASIGGERSDFDWIDLPGIEDGVIFVWGGGNALHGFSGRLKALKGFPLRGAWRPQIADLDGDGSPEIVSAGLDGMVHAYSFR